MDTSLQAVLSASEEAVTIRDFSRDLGYLLMWKKGGRSSPHSRHRPGGKAHLLQG